MLTATADGPTVTLSFANNFWGKEDAGVGPLMERMHNAKQTCDELKSFYNTRASIEDEYARKLLSLSRKSLGSQETGGLKLSLDVMRSEVESMAKQHQSIAAQMKSELEEPLAAFAGAMKERRKIVQNSIEKLHKVKMQQTQLVNKTRDRYEQECLKIKGYLAQGHMVMGQEERKNKAKLEKTQISVATTNTEYEGAVKNLEETTARWNREWKAAADKFQDLEEERLDFTKSSLWSFANIASTVCVSDDSSCEKIRLSLEKMEVEKDINSFIADRGTGQEIPDAPKYINFCRGDLDSQSETSEDDAYSVAQFPRSINPAYRTSSPQPSTFESHHDPNNTAVARDVGYSDADMRDAREVAEPAGQATPKQKTPQARPPQQIQQIQQAPQQKQLQAAQEQQPKQRKQIQQPPQQVQQQPMKQMQQLPPAQAPPQQKQLQQAQQPQQAQPQQAQQPQQPQQPQLPPPQQQRQIPYDRNEFSAVPHDPYPMDGMTMLCRTNTRPQPDMGSQLSSQVSSQVSSNSSARPSSRDSHSDYSIPTPYSSQELPSGATSPVKADPQQQQQQQQQQVEDDKKVAKRKSGFFQNHSPFRRKSTKDISAAAAAVNRNTWHPSQQPQQMQQAQQMQQQQQQPPAQQPPPLQSNGMHRGSMSMYSNGNGSGSALEQLPAPQSLLTDRMDQTASPDPIEANASLALNVGNNVFPVSTPDRRSRHNSTGQAAQQAEEDPIALALAELKGVTIGKQSTVRVSADRYHGLATPAPGTRGNSAVAAGLRGTPPPSYDQQVQRLGVPPQAVTSKAMKQTSQKFVDQTRNMFSQGQAGGVPPNNYGSAHARSRSTYDVPRTASPGTRRSTSPRPGYDQRSVSPRPRTQPPQQQQQQPPQQQQQQDFRRSASPNPYASQQRRQSSYQPRGSDGYYRHQSPADVSSRAVSPNPYRSSTNSNNEYRPGSSMGSGADMAVQLAPISPGGAASPASMRSMGSDGYGSQRSRGGGGSRPGTSSSNSRAMGLYDGGSSGTMRQRSKSVADGRQYTRDGRPIIHFARALYVYQAAIPEELGFSKGDVLAVLRHQDDGWWEATVHGGSGQVGLVPSNYLQPC